MGDKKLSFGGCRGRRSLVSSVLVLSMLFSSVQLPFMSAAYANPNGGTVVGGSATISGEGSSHVVVNQGSNRAVINWNDFSVGSGDRTQFVQPNKGSVAFNRVVGGNASQILGAIDANGHVILSNPNGIVFGAGSSVDAAGFVATTHDADTEQFMSGGQIRFNGNPNAVQGAGVINQGTIKVQDAGAAVFIAPTVENSGVIVAKKGRAVLGAANGFTLDLYGDNLVSFQAGDSITQTVLDANGNPVQALVKNSGVIEARGGQVLLTAQAARNLINQSVNMGGKIEAGSVTEKGGKIVLSSTDSIGHASGVVKIESGAEISAKGKTGGEVQVIGERVAVEGALIDASGSRGGGKVRIGGGWQGGEGLATATTTEVDANTVIKADATKKGKGGSIVLWSDVYTSYRGHLSAKGGVKGGNGGDAEVSGKHTLDFAGTIDLLAPKGKSGSLLLDPQNITIQTGAGAPGVTCALGVCTPDGDSSVLTVAALEAALASGNVEITTGGAGAEAGDITFANSVTWATANVLLVNAYRDITINGGVTISNTYNTSMVGATLPALLALRADSSGNGTGSVTNSGTIDFSGSRGAVSIFYSTAATAGTQTANGSWAAPTNESLSTQFTTYKLVNSIADLAAMTTGTKYALGADLDGGGAAFNGNTPSTALASANGILDGQYCFLAGVSVCAIFGLTLTGGAAVADVGMFSTIHASSIVRNLSLDIDVTQTYTGGGAQHLLGTLAGTNNGTVANVAALGDVNYTVSTPPANDYVGGLIGFNNVNTTNVTNTSASGNLTYSRTTSGGNIYLGGLIGQHQSIGAGGVTGSSMTGSVDATYSGNGTIGSGAFIVGGLIGYFTGASSALNNSYSQTGTVTMTNAINGGANTTSFWVGGLVGSLFSGSITGTSSSSIDTTYVYKGSSSGQHTVRIGGLVGYNSSTAATSINGASASGDVLVKYFDASYNSGNVVSYAGGLVGQNGGASAVSISNSMASGDVTDQTNGNSTHYVGGLIGYNNVSTGNITTSSASGAVTYTGTGTTLVSVGGLIGSHTAAGAGGISGSFATGNVSATYSGSAAISTSNFNVGGLIGSFTGASSVLTNSYSQTGTVTMTNAINGGANSTALYVGGLVGYLASGTITGTSYSSMDTTYVYKGSSSGAQTGIVGGLVGYNASTAAISISGATASGDVLVSYFDASYNTGNIISAAGGLVGQNGVVSAVSILNSAASGDVADETNGNSTHYVGGLIGYNAVTTGNITNSSASGNVSYTGTGTTNVRVGGLIGFHTSSSTGGISGSFATGNVNLTYTGSAAVGIGAMNAGGLIGYFSGATSTLNDSYSTTGAVTATNQINGGAGTTTITIGGLVGYLNSGAITGTSYSSMDVTYVYKGSSSGAQTPYIGGLAGYNTSTAATSISGASASGDVLVKYFDASYNTGTIRTVVGGLVGLNGTGTAVSIANSTASGDVTDETNGNTQHYIGGLIGYNSINTGNITNSSASGDVSYTGTGTTNVFVGGLIGHHLSGGAGGITGSFATGNVSLTYSGSAAASTLYLGGLIGYFSGASSALNNSYSQTGTVTMTNAINGGANSTALYVGGLVGYLASGSITGTSYSSMATNYVYKGSSSAVQTIYAGGLVGYNGSTAAVSVAGAYATSNVTASYDAAASGNKYVSSYLGGLIGQMGNTTAVVINTSYATGNVTSDMQGTGTTQALGGLVGFNNSNAATSVTNSYALGSVYYNGNLASAIAAGLIGINNGTATNSYAAGYVQQATGAEYGVSGNGTCTDCYWDSNTTGLGAGGVGTARTTAQLQAALQTGFSGATWGLITNTSYPYLLSQGTIQVMTGTAYSDHGTTGLGGGHSVAGLMNGSLLDTVQTGANGYYYFMLNPGTITNNQMLTYLTGATKANAFRSAATTNVTGLDLYADYLHVLSPDASLSTITMNLATAQGAFSGADFLYTLPSGDLTINVNKSLAVDFSGGGTSDIDKAISLSGTGILDLGTTASTITQSVALTVASLLLSGTGTYTLTNTSNAITTLAASGTSTIDFVENSGFAIGTVGGTAGLTATDVRLSSTGTVTQSQAIIAGKLLLQGAGATYTLTNAGNDITTLASNTTGTVDFLENSGFAIGTSNGVNGLTAGNAYISSTGTVTQSQAITTTNLLLQGAGGTYTLTNASNAITALASDTSGTVDFLENSGFDIGTVNGTAGLTATNAYLSSTGTVTQSQAITVSNLALLGAGAVYTLTNTNNNTGRLAVNAGTVNFVENSGFAIHTVNGTAGLTATNAYLSTTGVVTQAAAITATNLLLQSSGTYTLTNSSNAITTLAASGTSTVNFLENSGFAIGAVNGVNGLTATDAYLSSTGTVTQSQAIAATNLLLQGAAGVYTLTNASNAITTLAANTGSVSLNEAGGLTIGTVNGVNGVTTSGATSVVSTGGLVLARNISANGAGTTINLVGTSFDNSAAASLNAGTGRFLVWSANPAGDNRGGLSYDFKHYNATYGVTNVGGIAGNGFLYTVAPTVSTSLTGAVSKAYDGNTTATLAGANFTAVSGAIDGDTVTFTNPVAGTYDNKNVGTGKAISVGASTIASATNGSATIYGYQVGATADANIGAITAKALTVGGAFTALDKLEDGTTSATIDASGLSLVGGIMGDDVTMNAVGVFSDAAAGAGKTVYLTGSNISGADAGNYDFSLTGAPTALASIFSAAPAVPPGSVAEFIATISFDKDDEGWWLYYISDTGEFDVQVSDVSESGYGVNGFKPCEHSVSVANGSALIIQCGLDL